jgi:DEAD/DEAH box helicase domain-containing protein
VGAALSEGVQTLCFAVSRQTAELVAERVRKEAMDMEDAGELRDQVATYRAGYLPLERRKLEAAFKEGRTRALVSTNALEVGIDIGQLDAVVLSGFPGTMMSARQQMGRAGRSGHASVVVYVPFPDQLDQYLARHPAVFFGRPHEHAVLDWENPYVLGGHLLCAAAERPLTDDELDAFFGGSARDVLAALVDEGLVAVTPRGHVFQSRPAPTQSVQLDAAGSRPTIRIMVAGEELLETMDWSRALFEAHPGAVLLHQGAAHVVESLDLERHIAVVEPRQVDYWTEPMDVTEIQILREDDAAPCGVGRVHSGEVRVTTRIPGYRTRKFGQTISYDPLDLPELTYRAQAMWLTLPPGFGEQEYPRRGVMGGLHAAEHAMVGLLPLTVLCDRQDVGALSVPLHPDTLAPTIFVHERAEGGIGLAESAWRQARDLVSLTRRAVAQCPCEAGCPSCILSPTCSNDNVPIDKAGAIRVLEAWSAANPHDGIFPA